MTIPSPLSSFKNWLIALLLLAIVFLILTRGCNKPSPAITQNTTVNDTVAKIFAAAALKDQYIQELKQDSADLVGVVRIKDTQLSQWQNKAARANQQVTNLANAVASARQRNDTLSYEHACDSLAAVTIRNKRTVDSLKNVTRSAIDSREDVIKNRNTTISLLRSEANGYSSAAHLLKQQNGILVKLATPHTQVFVGLESEFNTVNLFQSAGVGIELKTKKDDIFAVGIGMMRQPVVVSAQFPGYLRLGFYRKISFHR